ncbi:MAG: hypothetical protein KF788_03820 [Piscinibacter sp.]|nr:hypothetical protein [Piscinibacter sp.]
MDLLTATLTLPMSLAGAMAGHVLAGRAVKAVLWSVSPLAEGEPQSFTYERDTFRTAEPGAMQVVGAAAAAGLLFWIAGLAHSWWLAALALLGWLAALGFDLLTWQRVAVSANNLWFQRGLGQTVHQVAFENIRDVAVEERDERYFTLRRGTRNRVCRLQVRMKDKRVVALPKTDAHTGLTEVEEVANQLRQRLRHLEDRESIRRSQVKGSEAAQAAAEQAPSGDADLRRALRKLRRNALTPDVPKAVKLPNGS